MSMIKASAICCKQNNSTFYVTVIKSDVLKKCAMYPERKKTAKKGFRGS